MNKFAGNCPEAYQNSSWLFRLGLQNWIFFSVSNFSKPRFSSSLFIATIRRKTKTREPIMMRPRPTSKKRWKNFWLWTSGRNCRESAKNRSTIYERLAKAKIWRSGRTCASWRRKRTNSSWKRTTNIRKRVIIMNMKRWVILGSRWILGSNRTSWIHSCNLALRFERLWRTTGCTTVCLLSGW